MKQYKTGLVGKMESQYKSIYPQASTPEAWYNTAKKTAGLLARPVEAAFPSAKWRTVAMKGLLPSF